MAVNVKRSYKESLERICKRSGFNANDVRKVFRALQDEIMDCLSTGHVFRWGHFGHFRVATLKARQRRNPQTGEFFIAPEQKRTRFKGSTTLQSVVNGEINLIDAISGMDAAADKKSLKSANKLVVKSKSKIKAKAKVKTTAKSIEVEAEEIGEICDMAPTLEPEKISVNEEMDPLNNHFDDDLSDLEDIDLEDL